MTSSEYQYFLSLIVWLVRRNDRVEDKLNRLLKGMKQDMATKKEILDKIAANTTLLGSVAVAVDELNDQSASIAEEIARLKKLIEDGQVADFTEVEALVDAQAGVIAGLETAIGKNVVPVPVAN